MANPQPTKCTLGKDGETITFSSGKTIRANCGIIGLSICDHGNVTHGYDGGIPYELNDTLHHGLTSDDMCELSDLMLDHWTRFRDSLNASKDPAPTLDYKTLLEKYIKHVLASDGSTYIWRAGEEFTAAELVELKRMDAQLQIANKDVL